MNQAGQITRDRSSIALGRWRMSPSLHRITSLSPNCWDFGTHEGGLDPQMEEPARVKTSSLSTPGFRFRILACGLHSPERRLPVAFFRCSEGWNGAMEGMDL